MAGGSKTMVREWRLVLCAENSTSTRTRTTNHSPNVNDVPRHLYTVSRDITLGAGGGIRTHTGGFLGPVPLPLGYAGSR
jgi:hypothetical protein